MAVVFAIHCNFNFHHSNFLIWYLDAIHLHDEQETRLRCCIFCIFRVAQHVKFLRSANESIVRIFHYTERCRSLTAISISRSLFQCWFFMEVFHVFFENNIKFKFICANFLQSVDFDRLVEWYETAIVESSKLYSTRTIR